MRIGIFIKRAIACLVIVAFLAFMVLLARGIYGIHGLDEPLNHAAERGDLQAVKEYVARGADIEYSLEGCGKTALVLSLYNGHDDVAKYLILHGADVKVTTNNNDTPLKLAKKGSKVYKMILERGGDHPKPSLW